MSAFLVSRGHVRFVVEAGLSLQPENYGPLSWYADDPATLNTGAQLSRACRELTRETADAVGSILWMENLRSIEARYPDTVGHPEKLPGTDGQDPRDGYRHAPAPAGTKIDPAAVLKSIDCLEYQSCEHDGWKGSEARRILEAIRDCATKALPGYEAAPWGCPDAWDVDVPFVRVAKPKGGGAR